MTSLTRRDLIRSGLALSASTLVSGSVGRAHALLASYPGAASAEAMSALPPREHLLFDFGWKFFQGHASDPLRDLGFGKGQGDFAKSGEFHFSTEKFDDSKWRDLNLPHDWAVELPFVHDEEQNSHGYKPLGRRYPETSVGWYRRTFDIPKEDSGRRITIEFDGAFRSALVFLNGYFIGRNDNGYAPFHFDVSDFLNYGAKNFLVVRMDASFGDGWFYEGAGIYRHVWLTKTDALHLGHWDSTVRTSVKGGAATLNLGTVVQNEGTQAENCRVHWRILDASGKVVATADSAPRLVEAGGSAPLTATANVSSPALWSPETPNLYSALVTVEAQSPRIALLACDAERITFGIRDLKWDADKGFFLNGKSVKIKGTCNHHDHAGVGAALPDRLQWYRVGSAERYGRQRRAHVAQHADAGMGGGLRPPGHDDDVRDAADERESGGHGTAGDDGEALSQLAVDYFVVHGQRRVDDDVSAAGPARHRRHDRAHPRTRSNADVHRRNQYRLPDAVSRATRRDGIQLQPQGT